MPEPDSSRKKGPECRHQRDHGAAGGIVCEVSDGALGTISTATGFGGLDGSVNFHSGAAANGINRQSKAR